MLAHTANMNYKTKEFLHKKIKIYYSNTFRSNKNVSGENRKQIQRVSICNLLFGRCWEATNN